MERSNLASLFAVAAGFLGWGSAEAAMTIEKISDSIVDTNALLVDATSARWGRAINGEAFQGNALISHNGYQYAAWYTNDEAGSVMVARRTILGRSAGEWNVVNTGFALTNTADDVHNVVSIGLARSDGSIHLSWDHHVNPLNYAKTAAGVGTTRPAAWGKGMFTRTEPGHLLQVNVGAITYPYFINTPSGDLQFAYRNGGSGDGEYKLCTYSGANGQWSAPRMFLGRTGTYTEDGVTSNSRNGYPNGFDYGPDGKLHTIWVWREDAAGANHDICYACSADGGITWNDTAGKQVADTTAGNAIQLDDASVIIGRLDLKQSLYNTQGQTVDANGGVHALIWHRRQDEPAYAWKSGDPKWDPKDCAYHHYYRNPANGTWSHRMLPLQTQINGTLRPLPIGRRGQILTNAKCDAFAIYTTRIDATSNSAYATGNLVIAGATAASGYSDWSILHIENVAFNGEPLVDKDRLLRDGVISVVLQEDSPVTTRTGSRLHVMEFVAQP